MPGRRISFVVRSEVRGWLWAFFWSLQRQRFLASDQHRHGSQCGERASGFGRRYARRLNSSFRCKPRTFLTRYTIWNRRTRVWTQQSAVISATDQASLSGASCSPILRRDKPFLATANL